MQMLNSGAVRRIEGVRGRFSFSWQAGFSLAEVTLSIAILAIAVIPIMALLPSGLDLQRSANERTTESQILQTLSGQYSGLEFSELESIASTGPQNWYFDVDGQPRAATEATRIYDARVTVNYPLEVPGNEGSFRNYSGARVVVELVRNPSQSSDAFAAESQARRHAFLVYRND